MKIKGSTALITGSAVRLGRGMAMHLARRGSDTVILHYRASEAEAVQLKAEIESLGANAIIIRGDLSTPEGIRDFLNECNSKCRGVQILINSASSFAVAPMLQDDVSAYIPSITLGALAPHALTVWAYRNAGLKKAINILDASPGLYAGERYGYFLGKSMLKVITERLAVELAPDVCVNAIAPGHILPPAGSSSGGSRIQSIPLKRRGRISELNMALDFLIHNDYITGQIIYVDGGMHLIGDRYDR